MEGGHWRHGDPAGFIKAPEYRNPDRALQVGGRVSVAEQRKRKGGERNTFPAFCTTCRPQKPKFSVQPFSKGWWGWKGQSPFLALRRGRNTPNDTQRSGREGPTARWAVGPRGTLSRGSPAAASRSHVDAAQHLAPGFNSRATGCAATIQAARKIPPETSANQVFGPAFFKRLDRKLIVAPLPTQKQPRNLPSAAVAYYKEMILRSSRARFPARVIRKAS